MPKHSSCSSPHVYCSCQTRSDAVFMTTRRVLEQSPVECVVFLLFISSSRRDLVIGVNNITTVSAFHKTQKQKRAVISELT